LWTGIFCLSFLVGLQILPIMAGKNCPSLGKKRPDSSAMREASGPELPAYLNSDMMLFGAWFAIERA
jgi:hypothetical protein